MHTGVIFTNFTCEVDFCNATVVLVYEGHDTTMHGMYCGLIVQAWYVLWSYCACMHVVCIVVLFYMHYCAG